MEFYNQYISFLSLEHELGANTVGKHVKTLKTFMNEATDRGYNTNLEFKKRKFNTLREESDYIYLTLDELEKLDLSANLKI